MCPGMSARTVQRFADPADTLGSHAAGVSSRQNLNQKILNFSTVCTGPCTLGDIVMHPILKGWRDRSKLARNFLLPLTLPLGIKALYSLCDGMMVQLLP